MTHPAPSAEPPGDSPSPSLVLPATEAAAAPVLLDASPAERSAAPIGPGLWESLLWILGFFLLEIVGSFVWFLGALAYQAASGETVQLNETESLLKPVMPWMIGSLKLLGVAAVLAAIRLRFGASAFQITGFRSVPALHAFVLACAVLPTAFLSGQCYALFLGPWETFTKDIPFLRSLNDLSSIKEVQEMAAATPLLVLVVIIAVLPALNEEFLFRAAIGRGLLGRYGLIPGVALTSMLFAAVHLSPVHAAALLPLSVLLHVAYLSSGSVWACVGIHFLNNALSVGLMKLSTLTEEVGGMTTDVTDTRFSPLLFVASSACVVSTIWLLKHARVRWLLPDGREWRTDYPSVESPSAGAQAVRVVPSIPAGPIWVTAISYLAFPVAFGVAAALGQT